MTKLAKDILAVSDAGVECEHVFHLVNRVIKKHKEQQNSETSRAEMLIYYFHKKENEILMQLCDINSQRDHS